MLTRYIIALGFFAVCTTAVPGFLHAQIKKYDLGIRDKTLEEGDTLRVVWIAPERRTSTKDWIGLYERGDSDRKPLEWKYIDSRKEFGTVTFRMDDEGRYEVRMFTKDSYRRVAIETGITVRDDRRNNDRDDDDDDDNDDDDDRDGISTSYDLALVDRSIDAGEKAQVEWSIPRNQINERHWVGIYRANDRDEEPYAYQNISTANRIGTVTFTMKETGRFEARMFRGSGYERVYTDRDTLRVDDGFDKFDVRFMVERVSPSTIVEVAYTAPAFRSNGTDWIGIYKVGENNKEYYAWQYIPRNTTSGTLKFSIGERGTYEARVFTDNTFTDVASSDDELIVR
jgi:hypothetical protein